jgi:hypothetical protein
VYIPSVWRLLIPPRVHFFLWLLSNNRLLTRDNLNKKSRLDDSSYLFCIEGELTNHLFVGTRIEQELEDPIRNSRNRTLRFQKPDPPVLETRLSSFVGTDDS